MDSLAIFLPLDDTQTHDADKFHYPTTRARGSLVHDRVETCCQLAARFDGIVKKCRSETGVLPWTMTILDG